MPSAASSAKVKKVFDYNSLDSNTSKFVQEQTGEIQALMKRTAQSIIKIGQKLIEVKGHLGHGRFGDWLEAEFGWTDRTARQFMQVAETFKSENFSDLSFAPSALYKLAAPSTPESARLEAIARAEAGELITHKTAKALKQKYVSASKKTELEPETEAKPETVSLPTSEIPLLQESRSKPEIVALIPRTQLPATASESQLIIPAINLPLTEPLKILTSASEQPEMVWQLDGKHLLFCGDPSSKSFQNKAPTQVSLLFAFPTALDWYPSILAATKHIMSEQQLERVLEKKGSQDIYGVFESIMLDCSDTNSPVVVNFLPLSVSSLILNLANCLLRRAIVAEPDRKRCQAALTFWKKEGGKVEQLN